MSSLHGADDRLRVHLAGGQRRAKRRVACEARLRFDQFAPTVIEKLERNRTEGSLMVPNAARVDLG